MAIFRELSLDEIKMVSGGGNAGDHDRGNSNQSGGRSGGGGAPKICANYAGPFGVIGLGLAGAAAASLGCPDNSPYRSDNRGRQNDPLGGDANPHSVNGQCH